MQIAKGTVIIFVLLVLLVGVGMIYKGKQHSSTTTIPTNSTITTFTITNSPTSSPTTVVPPQTTTYPVNWTEPTLQWIQSKLVQWKPSSVSQMNFSAVLSTASYSNIYTYNLSTQLANLQMLNSTGISIVRIDVDFDPWLSNDTATIAKMDAIASQIKANGQKFCIADSSAESYRKHPLSWSAYQTAWINRVKVLSARYQPYCYIVVKEPAWYIPMISTSPYQYAAVGQWVNLTQNLINSVHSVSPSTLIGVAVPGSSIYHSNSGTNFILQYMQAASQMGGINFLGFDDYGEQDLYDTMQFISQVGLDGKGGWIAETWGTPGIVDTPYNASRSQIDPAWLNLMYYFGLDEHIQTIVPFFTNIFSSYSPNINSPAYFQNRTAAFYEYQKIISANRAGKLVNASS